MIRACFLVRATTAALATTVLASASLADTATTAAPAPAARAQAPSAGLRELARSAPLIVQGTVVEQMARRDSRGLIVTTTWLRIDDVVSGQADSERLALTTLGGELGGQLLSVSHMPRFETGQRYIVFADPHRTTYDPVVGAENGVFRLGDDGQVRTYEGTRVLGIADGRLLLGEATGAGVTPGAAAGAGDAGPPQVSGGVHGAAAPAQAEAQAQAEAAAMGVAEFVQAIQALR